MSILTSALHYQIEKSIYSPEQSSEAKLQIAEQCDIIKKASLITAVVVPIFAFLFPTIFGIAASVAVGIIGFDLFNMADNLHDAAVLSAEGPKINSDQRRSHLDMLLDGTVLTNTIYKKWLGTNG